MASFAELDENNKVINVIKISNQEVLDENGNESEEVGIQRCKNLFGENTKWVQTFFGDTETPRRGNPAKILGYYIESLDAFTTRKIYDSWTLNEETLNWESPIPVPPLPYENPIRYEWNEETTSWQEVEVPKPEISEFSNIDYEWDPNLGVWKIIQLEEPVGIATS